MDVDEKKRWANNILEQLLKQGCDLSKDEFVFLCGQQYRKYIQPHLKRCKIPNQGLGIGQQLHKYSQQKQLCITFPKD